jgi:hypothetical protein
MQTQMPSAQGACRALLLFYSYARTHAGRHGVTASCSSRNSLVDGLHTDKYEPRVCMRKAGKS